MISDEYNGLEIGVIWIFRNKWSQYINDPINSN